MITTHRYGEPRSDNALRIGTTRYPPRGVRQQDYAAKDHFDLWLRALSPSATLLGAYRKGQLTFPQFEVRYRAEMKQTEPRQVMDMLALLSRHQPLSVGCSCQKEDQCHRSILKELLTAAAAALPWEFGWQRRPSESGVMRTSSRIPETFICNACKRSDEAIQSAVGISAKGNGILSPLAQLSRSASMKLAADGMISTQSRGAQCRISPSKPISSPSSNGSKDWNSRV